MSPTPPFPLPSRRDHAIPAHALPARSVTGGTPKVMRTDLLAALVLVEHR